MVLRVAAMGIVVVLAGLLAGTPSPVSVGALVPNQGSDTQVARLAELTSFISGIRNRLKGCHGRLIGLGEAILKSIESAQTAEIDPNDQAIKVEAAKATLKRATLV